MIKEYEYKETITNKIINYILTIVLFIIIFNIFLMLLPIVIVVTTLITIGYFSYLTTLQLLGKEEDYGYEEDYLDW